MAYTWHRLWRDLWYLSFTIRIYGTVKY